MGFCSKRMNRYISPDDSFKVEEAISYLVCRYAESGNNPKPVIFHSIRVGMCLLECGYAIDFVITGILHDLMEDSDVTFEQIKTKFSEDIAKWVEAVSFKPDIKDPIAQYTEMFRRTISAGKVPIVVKAADLLVNSFYIHLVADLEKQRQLVQKMLDFINLTAEVTAEPILGALKERYDTENGRLSALERNTKLQLHED